MREKSSNTTVLILLLLLLGVAFYSFDAFIYQAKVKQIVRLNEKIIKKNEQLIAAQILAQDLSGVASLIKANIAESESDPLITTSVIPFLKLLTRTLDELEIDLLSIQPKPSKKAKKSKYVQNPYQIQIFCNYKKLGQFVNKIEKDDRMVRVNEFDLKSNMDYLLGKKHDKGIDNHVIDLELSTLTLLKNELDNKKSKKRFSLK